MRFPCTFPRLRNDLVCVELDVNDIKPSGVASYGALGHVPLSTISLVVPFGVNLTATYPNIV